MKHEKIAVLDFGGQYSHLIANRIRRLNVFSEILDPETPPLNLKKYKGIILSGGPMSVYDEGAPHSDKGVFELGVPILGICYGHQLMQYLLGGDVEAGGTKEYGFAQIEITESNDIFKGVKSPTRAWMSHGDTVRKLALGFEEIGRTPDLLFSAVADMTRHFYGVQFHPEVTHTPEGMKMLDNFLKICDVSRDWSIQKFIKEEIDAIKEKIGDKNVFLLVSGGVDSTVCFALLEKALGPDRVYGFLIDTGLMRQNEAEKVKETLEKAGFTNLHVVDAKKRFLKGLKEVTDPEEKRRIIGYIFWEVKEDVAEERNLDPDEWIVAQGTIYPDTIETKGTKYADLIKTHHNRVDLMQKLILEGKVIEPLAQLYKDEVRSLGEQLGLPHDLVWRQPFPGPGLAVRILCVNEASAKAAPDFTELNTQIEAFVKEKFDLGDLTARVLPIKSVGVQGDERTYRHPVALFTSTRDWNQLEKISTAITNRFSDVNRVILALSGKPDEPFTLTPADINTQRVGLLQHIDDTMAKIMTQAPKTYEIWQFPMVLMPISTETGKESIVLRPVVSTEAMTASFARIDWAVVDKLVDAISQESAISHIFYDLTHKPPGTIEWE